MLRGVETLTSEMYVSYLLDAYELKEFVLNK